MNGLKQYEQAIENYDKAIQINSDDYKYYLNRGVAYSRGLSQHEQAVKDFEKAIELNPNLSEVYNTLFPS